MQEEQQAVEGVTASRWTHRRTDRREGGVAEALQREAVEMPLRRARTSGSRLLVLLSRRREEGQWKMKTLFTPLENCFVHPLPLVNWGGGVFFANFSFVFL